MFLNQAGALLLVYADGSVLLAHGGVEMGQGLHTKMIQVASSALDIPIDLIHVKETSTDKVANASPTAASFSSDLNGMAVLVSIYTQVFTPVICDKTETGIVTEFRGCLRVVFFFLIKRDGKFDCNVYHVIIHINSSPTRL